MLVLRNHFTTRIEQMPYEIYPGPREDIVVLKYTGQLTHDDMMINEPLGLHLGPRYILLDASELDASLPEGYFESSSQSFFVHPNMQFMAFYVKSQVLRTAGIMVSHLSRQTHKVTIHQSYEKAMEALVKVAEEQNPTAPATLIDESDSTE